MQHYPVLRVEEYLNNHNKITKRQEIKGGEISEELQVFTGNSNYEEHISGQMEETIL